MCEAQNLQWPWLASAKAGRCRRELVELRETYPHMKLRTSGVTENQGAQCPVI